MMTQPPRPMRVVVCGTRFGQVYLSALARAEDYELAGIVARGSARSTALARDYGVPLYPSVDSLPDDIDAACVVVSTAVGGGSGADLAKALLERGIHVLQEHPVHPTELADCLKVARRTGSQYLVNTFYPHLEPVRRFTAAARKLVTLRKAVFVDAMCAIQVSYDLIDILAEVFDGLKPWSLAPVPQGAGLPLACAHGQVGGVPLTLRVENRMQAGDDSTSLFLHRITIGTDAGNLMLANTHGPVIWSPVLRVRSDEMGRFLPVAAQDGSWADDFGGRTADYLGPAESPTWATAVDELWSGGVVTAMDDLRGRVEAGADPLRRGRRALAVAHAWKDLTEAIGYPHAATPDAGDPLTVADL
ncbi:thiazolinyl imide reductase [Actinokineospora alba]|uniref:Thiazolinyl imide reductase n=2 Tax=Actinokineospora alba TaxID=504798 RepID=A0A1H0FWN3_9PSEU|nr:thiazolinyl imide reductase [Actinokineospora alba]SDI11996.1 thiazolinyl imide reductase [Actinokineospora alba]SDN98982.1 thiazolinyl imide reductase [Actinokineospora alba]